MIVTVINIVVKSENVDQFIEATIENHQDSIKEKGNLRVDRGTPISF